MNSFKIKLLVATCLLGVSIVAIGVMKWLTRSSDELILPTQALVPVPVFYPKYIRSNNCDNHNRLLLSGKLIADGNYIGLFPDWSKGRYGTHSLRFLDCLIWEAEQGNQKSFALAKNTILDWNEKNKFSEKIHDWTWKDNETAWSEHGVSWRAILLSYFYRTAQKLSIDDRELIKSLQEMAKAHAAFLSSKTPYLPNNNHGLNNAMGLLSLGTTFQELPDALKWVDLSLARAEQQMNDNVSSEGIHLEQSGFYHFYTLRTFMEIYVTAEDIGRPMSNEYRQKLDKMLGVGSLMAGPNRVVEGVPWSNHGLNVFNYLKKVDTVNLGTPAPGKTLFQQMKQGKSEKRLVVNPEGGYSFFTGRFDKDLEIVFHHRILAASHAQEDPLGLTAILGNQRILTYGNYDQAEREAKDFNIVQVSHLQQNSKLKLKLDSKGRLRERLTPRGGEILESGSVPQLDFITARHQGYPGVTHIRTVARIGSLYLLIWDRLEADTEHQYTQTFHFPVPAQIEVERENGIARLFKSTLARFIQLEKEAKVSICDLQSKLDFCSVERDKNGKITATPEIGYQIVGKKAEFLWVLSTGAGRFASRTEIVKDNGAEAKLVRLSGENGNYKVLLQGSKLSLK